MKWPIVITRNWKIGKDGYKVLYSAGNLTSTARNFGGNHYDITYHHSNVRFQVWVARWVLVIPSLPERAWSYVLCRLWLDRLSFQYERGYADGLREALNNYEAYKDLTPEELAGVLAEPPNQEY